MLLTGATGQNKLKKKPWGVVSNTPTPNAGPGVNVFEGPVTGNIPEVLDNGEVTDGTHVTAGQLALAVAS